MKKFDIITESDARVLAHGETVMLARRGHITPLAQDTLKERRVTVLAEDSVSADEASLAPCAEIRTVAIASDHTGIALRKALVTFLRGRGLSVNDLGTDSTDPVDYPDVAASVARPVARSEADAGIVDRRRGHRLRDRGEQDPWHPRGDGNDRNHRALFEGA